MSIADNDAPKKAPWWVLPGLGVLVLLIFAGGLVVACFLGNETLLTTMLTATVTLATGVIGYFFGSSVGSQRKDDTLADAAKTAAAKLGSGQPDQPIAIAVAGQEKVSAPAAQR